MSDIDHRAEAERYAKFARELWRTDSAEAAQAATVSLAHATLACSTASTGAQVPQSTGFTLLGKPATFEEIQQHVSDTSAELRALRDAAQALITAIDERGDYTYARGRVRHILAGGAS